MALRVRPFLSRRGPLSCRLGYNANEMPKANKRKRKYHFKHSYLARWWRRYEYKHTTIAFIAIAAFVLALDTALVQASLAYIKDLGIAGVIMAGALFTSFFTAAPATVMLIEMGEIHNPLVIALYGGIGSVIGDWIILKVFEERVGYELLPLVKKFRLRKFLRSLRKKKNRERTTLAGMLMVASPLPDEIGIGLLGIAHLPTISLLIITFLLNGAGILVLILATR